VTVPLKLVLMGTGEFAVPPFEAVMKSGHQVVAVFTQPDRGARQHRNVVKELAVSREIPVFQPERVNRPEILDSLQSMDADVFLVAAYGQILKPELLAIPRLGAFNLHGSLLPRHRGAAPVQYSIWKGDEITGVTIFRIEPALDSGPMVGKVTTQIDPEETSGDLMLRLAQLCVPMTLDVLNQLEQGTATFEPQDVSQVTLAPKIPRDAGVVQWQASAKETDCHVRAMQPWPKASTILHRQGHPPLRCIIVKVRRWPGNGLPSTAEAGAVRNEDGRLLVRVGDGWLEVVRIQPEGRKAMDGPDFLRGYPVQSGDHCVPG
jgi:methionyl-tRNA formyltransferase